MSKENIFRVSTNPTKNKNRNKELNILKKTHQNISMQEAYDILEGPEFCQCGEKSRFVSLKLGYSKYCSEQCYDLDNGYDYNQVIDKLKSGWKPSSKQFTKIKKLHNLTSKDLYDIVFGKQQCRYCGSETTFQNYKSGYLTYCSVSCSNMYKDFSRTKEKNAAIQRKRQKTCMERYGVKNNLLILDNSGTNNIMHKNNESTKSKLAKLKKQTTMLKRYNRTHPVQADHIKNRDQLNEEYILLNFCQNNRFNVQLAQEYFNCSRTYFNKFNLPKKVNYGEEWVYDIVGGKRNDRTIITPLEVDVLNEHFNVAVEFNGLAFHSIGRSSCSIFNTVDSNNHKQHQKKTDLCESLNYQLFHIFENEYLDPIKRKIWESVLNFKMGRTQSTIYARKCNIKLIDKKIEKNFCEQNHLQGSGNSSIKLGLYYQNELVSVMTFGKARFSKKYQYELIRYCNKVNYNIPGAFSKLLKYFERNYNPQSIISYANRRWSQGNVYQVNGFSFSHNSGPNYFYFKPAERVLYSRNKFQKHKLVDMLEHFNPDLSESENMYNHGYRKIYDSGNMVFYKNYKNSK